jgi:hypothetical protein
MVLSYMGEGGACRKRYLAEMKTTVMGSFLVLMKTSTIAVKL